MQRSALRPTKIQKFRKVLIVNDLQRAARPKSLIVNDLGAFYQPLGISS